MDCFVGVVRLRLIPVPRCRVDMTVGWQDADVAHQHHPGEKKNTQPSHYEAVNRQPHWEGLYTVLYRRQAKSLRRAPAPARIILKSVQRGFARGHGFGFFLWYVRFARTLSISFFRCSADSPSHREVPPEEEISFRRVGDSILARLRPPFFPIFRKNSNACIGTRSFRGLMAAPL